MTQMSVFKSNILKSTLTGREELFHPICLHGILGFRNPMHGGVGLGQCKCWVEFGWPKSPWGGATPTHFIGPILMK